MKTNLLIFVIISFVPIIFCASGGVRAAINETMITSLLNTFKYKINSEMKNIDLGSFKIWFNIHGVNVWLHFPDNFLSYFDIKLINGGLNIKTTKPMSASATGKVRFKFVLFSIDKKLTVRVNNFRMDANIAIKSERLKDGGYRPKVEFMSSPDVNADIRVESGGISGMILSALANLLISIFKKKIINLGVNEGESQLMKIVNKFETEVPINKDLVLDYSLIDPIKVYNKFIELNAYGVLYNKNKENTKKNKNGMTFTQLPSISKLEKQFQLYVSEYTLNSALYTYLETYYKPINFKVSSNIAELVFPEFKSLFNDKEATFNLRYRKLPKLQVTENGIFVKSDSLFNVTVPSRLKPIFYSEVELTLGVYLNVNYGPSVTINIKDLSAKLGTTYIKDVCQNKIPNIEVGFKAIENTIILLINALAKNMVYDFKPIMGIKFTDIKLENKNGYLVIYYNVSK